MQASLVLRPGPVLVGWYFGLSYYFLKKVRKLHFPVLQSEHLFIHRRIVYLIQKTQYLKTAIHNVIIINRAQFTRQ